MIKIAQILADIEYLDFIGNTEHEIKKVSALNSGENDPHALIWCSDKNLYLLEKIEQGIIICSQSAYENHHKANCHYLIVKTPRQTFQQIIKRYFMQTIPEPNIESSARIASSASIAPSAYIGHNVVIEDRVSIGAHTIIGHNTVIAKDTIIGSHVMIGANNTIGNIGFGYEKNNDGIYEFIPHLGYVLIEDHVEIGNNTCIDRAVLGYTWIRKSAKIDNLVHIAHGVEIGENALIIANAMIAGSVTVGPNSWVAPSSSVLNQKSVGENATIGLGAVVIRDVPDNDIVVGNPAKSIKKID
jgi:UDP-3-O-[3-hydroxymyristoyl] glucosamine N-acyltransferase